MALLSPLNNIYSFYISHPCLVLSALTVGTVSKGIGGQSGAILGNGGGSSPEALVVSWQS